MRKQIFASGDFFLENGCQALSHKGLTHFFRTRQKRDWPPDAK